MRWWLNLLEIFLGAKNEEEVKRKGVTTSIGAAIYWVSEYGIVLVTAALVGLLEYWGLTEFQIFLLLWTGCMILAMVIIRLNEQTGVDFTFFAGYARLTKKYHAENIFLRIASWIGAGLVAILWIFWQGPAPVVIFLMERKKMEDWIYGVIVIIISFFQMIVWTKLYILGLDSLSDIYHYFIK